MNPASMKKIVVEFCISTIRVAFAVLVIVLVWDGVRNMLCVSDCPGFTSIKMAVQNAHFILPLMIFSNFVIEIAIHAFRYVRSDK